MTHARLDDLTRWSAEWRGLRVAVLGLSVTGFSVVDTLAELGADVLVVTESASEEYQALIPILGQRALVTDLSAVPDDLVAFDPEVVIASPGFAPAHPVIRWAVDGGRPLWGDIELAWRVRDKVTRADGRPADWVCITGTNGKTTTTRLTASMLVAGGLRAAPCGNIGVPVLDAVRDPAGFDVLVVELSSHQLWYLSHASIAGQPVPWASACLNLAPDHAAWHGGAEPYRDAKAQVYRNTVSACIYNRADDATRVMVEDAEVTEGARAIGFGLDSPGLSDLGIVDGIAVDRAFIPNRKTTALEITTIAELRAAGLDAPHIVQNVLAASAFARSLDVSPDAIRAALSGFRLDPHRIEVVSRAGGVTWVNDSKATNTHAAVSSLSAFPGAIWVLGGDFKGVDIDEMIRDHGVRASAVIAIGVDQRPIVEAFQRHAPSVPVNLIDPAETESVMTRVVRLAADLANDGDVVLLAPAAASFDQFRSFEDRGEQFAHAVRDYEKRRDADGGRARHE